ncbi:Bug family tripartite tricarboxylate transporter substrate binding protein [Variovorax ginsengisoli]|uniref:Tripartite-type tricarboxylate transporter receptor subunit TctC n=1 Tax=Variovorax ginsengisoli TaxID=363844 RepID=A0ABT9S8V9_9BURK|nr:tripartite tricarboxylate transporter substrate binding protein [Variovorax ginsengisoli]MDP9900795.1 tripartite-type tricarboxylate transporter receptor subunit TctC [Variovorax ginsengisoli]
MHTNSLKRTAWNFRPLGLGLIALALCGPTCAQTKWPGNTAVKILVGNAPGGASDNLARALALEMSRKLDHPVIVENVSGAHGAQAAQKVLAAEPDGQTLLFGSTSDLVVLPLTTRQAGYQPSDFTAIAKISSSPMVLVARPNLSSRTVHEIIEVARGHPQKLSMGTTYERSVQSLAASAFMRTAKVEMALVRYRGGAPILEDLSQGRLDLAVLTLPSVLRQARTGKIRIIGLMTPNRVAMAPEVPTLSESYTIGGISMLVWVGMAGPPKLPPAVVTQINKVIGDVLADPKFGAARLEAGDILEPPAPSTVFAQFIEDEAAFYRTLLRFLPSP